MVLIGRSLLECKQKGQQRLPIRRAQSALEVCGHQILEAGHDLGRGGEDGSFQERPRLGPLSVRPADHPVERRPDDDDSRVERMAAGAVFGKDLLAPRLQSWAASTAGCAQTDEQEDDREVAQLNKQNTETGMASVVSYPVPCWSGRRDLNSRPHGPEPCALPG